LAKNEAGVPLGGTTLDTLMFADDIILLSASADGLNKQIGTLEEFCSQWNLRINTEKSKICTFRARKHHHFKCEGTYLENIDAWGVWISKNRKFNKAKNHISLQAKKVVFALELLSN
jgi:hypothetical protein